VVYVVIRQKFDVSVLFIWLNVRLLDIVFCLITNTVAIIQLLILI